ncbi:MAG: hypothetical protein AB7L90_25790 [Hyphomicrobiaceae bacterium]
MPDIFRPSRDPARSIYDAFQAEATHRIQRPWPDCHEAEVAAVWRAARDYAQQHGLRVPTLAEVRRVERSASGHIDYGSKWAHYVSELLYSKDRANV